MFDARSWSTATTDIYPAMVRGSKVGAVWVGGLVDGQLDTEATWHTLKETSDGAALVIGSSRWSLVDGLRARNVMDGVRPQRTPEPTQFTLRNCWFQDIRDDAVENDGLLGGTIKDCLFEGAFVGISCQKITRNFLDDDLLTIQDSLIRIKQFPFETHKDNGTEIPPDSLVDGNGCGILFKWQAGGDEPPLLVKDCILRVDWRCIGSLSGMNFPTNGTYENVTLIWLGEGDYPGTLPASGVTVTTDVTVWDTAVAQWKARHGVTDFYTVDMAKFLNPDPIT